VTAVLAKTITDYGVAESRITVISNGVDPARFPLPPEKSPAPQAGQKPRLVLGFTGFIRGWNAVDRLIDFAARHRDAYDIHILVVGDGPARPDLEARARELDITDKLTITGIVGRDAVTEYVSGFDIAVLPDVTPYSSPLKLFEYLQLGAAIVGPDMANIREILTDGENALLFSRDGANNLEAALLKLCADADLRARLGRAAHGTIVARSLTWKDCARRVTAVADGLLRQTGAGSAARGNS